MPGGGGAGRAMRAPGRVGAGGPSAGCTDRYTREHSAPRDKPRSEGEQLQDLHS